MKTRTQATTRRTCRQILTGRIALAAAFLTGTAAHAVTYYWDSNGTGVAGAGPTPNGTWGLDAFWSTDSTGANVGSPVLTATTTALDNVVFSAGTDAVNPYTIGLNSATQNAKLVTFEDGTVTLSNTGTLSLGAGGGLTVTTNTVTGATISSNLTITGGQSFTVGAGRTLALDTGTFTRNAGATLDISGTVTSTMTGLSANDATGIIGNWAFSNGAYAKFSGSTITNLGYTGAADGTSVAASTSVVTGTGGLNYTLSGVGTLGASASINTLRTTLGGTLATSGSFTTNGIFNNSGAGLTFSGAVTIGSGNALVVNDGGGGINFNGIISGAAGASFTKLGGQTTILTAANTYSGNTFINGGTVQIGNAGATGSLYTPTVTTGNLTFGSAGAIVDNSALVYNLAGGAVNVNSNITGTGTLSVTGNQSVNFAAGTAITTTGSQTYSATATTGRYFGFNLTDGGTTTLTSTAGNISMTGFLGTANVTNGNLVINTSAGNGTVTLNTPVGISGVDFGLNALTVTSGTGTITLGTFSAQNWVTVNTISLTGGAINSTAVMTSFTTLNVTNSLAGIFSGNLTSVGGALNKAGGGNLTLSGANTFAGGLNVRAGTVILGSATGAGAGLVTLGIAGDATSGTLNLNGGSRDIKSLATAGTAANQTITSSVTGGILNYNGANTSDFGGVITGTTASFTALTVNNASAILTLSGATSNTYTGATIVTAGTLNLGKSGTANAIAGGALNIGTGATVTYTGASTDMIANTAPVTVTGTGVLNLNGVSDTIGTLGLTATAGNNTQVTVGAGTLTLNGTLSFTSGTTGTATISGGTLALGIAGTRSINVPLGTSATFDLDITSSITGAGSAMTAGSAGRLRYSGSTSNTYDGLTTVNGGGTLLLNKSGGAFNAIAGGGLTIGAASNTAATVQYTGSSTDMMGAGTVTINGRGILDFNGATDTIGNVAIVSTGATATNPTPIINTLGSGNLTIGTLAITPVATFTSVVNSGATGTLTLGGDVTFTAATTGQAQITGQTLALGAATRTFTVALGTGSNQDVLVSAAITGSGVGLTKAGAGRLALSGTNTYDGATSVNAGTLLVNSPGSLHANSAVTVASGATLGGNGTIGGTVSIAAGGNLSPGASAGAIGTLTLTNNTASALTLNGGNSGAPNVFDLQTGSNDLVAVTGNLVLNGVNTLSLNAPTGAAAGAYTLLSYAATTGSGSVVFANGSTTMGNSTLAVTPTAVTLTIAGTGVNTSAWKGTISGVWDGGINNWTRNGVATQAFVAGDDVTFDNTATTFTVTSGGTVTPSSVTVNNTTAYSINATIGDSTINGGSATPVTKSGSGSLTLGGTNTYTGGTIINGGTLVTTSDVNLGTSGGLTAGSAGGVTVNGTATWNFSTATLVTYARTLTINEGAVLSLSSGNAGKTVSGALTGNGSIIGTATTGYDFSNAGNTFTGAVTNGYQMSFTSIGDSTNPINIGNSVAAGGFVWNGGAKTFALRPFTIQLAGTINSIANNGSGAIIIQQPLTISGGAGARTLTLQGSNTGANDFQGAIADGPGSVVTVNKLGTGNWKISGNMSNTGGLNISAGTGTLTLSGTNTYSGNTNFANSATTLTIAGVQAASANTTFVMNTNVSTSDSTLRLLDDTGNTNGGTAAISTPVTIQNNNAGGNGHTFIVGNNNTTNGGTSSGTTTGSTISMPSLTWGSYASGTVNYGPINIQNQGANGYRLQIDSVVLHNAANNTSNVVGNTVFNPTTANVTLGTVKVGTGNVNQGLQTLVLDGTSSDNRITGAITNATDFGTSNRALSVTKSNTSTWTLSGNNTYTGQTTVSSTGTLILSGDNIGMTGNVVLSTATTLGPKLHINSATALGTGTLNFGGGLATDSVQIDNSSLGTVNVSTNNVFTLNRDFTFVGTRSLNFGNMTTTLGGLAAGGVRNITVTANTLTFGGSIAQAALGLRVNKLGAGTLVLVGTNTYSGATTVSAGVLQLSNNATGLGFGGIQNTATGATTVNNGFTLDLNGASGINEPIIISGTGIGGNGALINSGAAASISNGIAGLTIGATSTGSGYSTAPTVSISGTGTLATATATLGVTAASFGSPTPSGTVTSATVAITGGGGTGATATVTTAGVITITNPGTGYTSAPTITATVVGGGSITYGPSNATNFTVSGVQMTAAGSGYTGTPTYAFGSGNATPGSATLSSVNLAANSSIGGSGDITIDAVVSETGVRALTKVGAGRLLLSGNNTYTGVTQIDNGTLEVATIAANGTAQPLGQASSDILLGSSSGATLRYSGASPANFGRGITVNGSGGGTVSNIGGNTLTLSGTLTKNGRNLTLNAGPSSPINVTGGIQGSNPNSDLFITGSSTVTVSTTNNPYNGATTVGTGSDSPTLAVTGSLSGTTAVTVNGGGTLLLNGGSNIIGGSLSGNTAITPDAGAKTVNGGASGLGLGTSATRFTSNATGTGGTLAVAQGAGGNGTSHQFSSMTLTSGNTILDFSSGGAGNTNVNLFFSSLDGASASALFANGRTLTINGWIGQAYSTVNNTGVFGTNVDPAAADSGNFNDGANRLLFTSDPGFGLGNFIQGISFNGTAGATEVKFGAMFEIVPVPEPATTALIGSVALCALIGYRERRRFVRRVTGRRTV